MTDLIVVRHGQSVADIEEKHEGRADFPLTELGRQQAQKAAVWIKQNHMPDIIISSTLKRASETAERIVKESKAELRFENDLMERNNGVLAGLLRTEAATKYPDPVGGHKPHESVEGGESDIHFRTRAENYFSRLLAEIETKHYAKVCLVAHGGMINMLFRSFLNLPFNTNVGIRTGDTGIHIWRLGDKQRNVLLANSLEHLRDC